MKEHENLPEHALASLEKLFTLLDAREAFHEAPVVKLSSEEIVEYFTKYIGDLNSERDNIEPHTLERWVVFFERCVALRIYEDLLGIPNEVRAWTTNGDKWDNVRKSVTNVEWRKQILDEYKNKHKKE